MSLYQSTRTALIILASSTLVFTGSWHTPLARAATPVAWQFKAATMAPATQNDLSSSGTLAALHQLANAGANMVVFVPTWYQDTIYSTSIYQTGNTASDASLITAIQEAKSLGLNVAIKPHVDPLDGAWRAHIHPCSVTNAEPCPAQNDLAGQWFASYTTIMDHYADLAQQYGVTQLCIGAELIDLSTNTAYTHYWTGLISDIRSRFGGSLTYSANWGGDSFAQEYNRIPFWGSLDYIGISAYFPLASSNNPTVDGMRSTWQNSWMPQINAVRQQWNKPILFTEIGYRSGNGTAAQPWNSGASWPADPQQQANCYEATFQAWANVSWFAGAAFWYWSTNPNTSSSDTDYTVQNKPAYTTIASWFGPTTRPPTPSPVPTATPTTTSASSLGGGSMPATSTPVRGGAPSFPPSPTSVPNGSAPPSPTATSHGGATIPPRTATPVSARGVQAHPLTLPRLTIAKILFNRGIGSLVATIQTKPRTRTDVTVMLLHTVPTIVHHGRQTRRSMISIPFYKKTIHAVADAKGTIILHITTTYTPAQTGTATLQVNAWSLNRTSTVAERTMLRPFTPPRPSSHSAPTRHTFHH